MNMITKTDSSISELENTQKLCQMLLASPHYKKIGSDGIYAIVEMSKSVGADTMQALNGGMYYVKGKVEMSALMMNTLVRQAGHSITKDKSSDETICILHGKRADTGDTWSESFSMEDAKKAGLLGSVVWKSYQKDMLFARALSRLARQLFPDVIKGCYVEKEIELAEPLDSEMETPEVETIEIDNFISDAQIATMEKYINGHDSIREQVLACCNDDFSTITLERFPGAIHWIKELVLQEEKANV